MKPFATITAVVVIATTLLLQSCGDSTSSAGSSSASNSSGGKLNATYTSIDDASVKFTIQFKGNGTVHLASELGTDEGTYAAEGDKITVTVKGQNFTFVRSGNCIEDITVFGKLCIGGKASEALGPSAAPKAPSGTYTATHEVGDFTLEFRGGNALTLTATAKGEPPESAEGTYSIEGTTINVSLPQGERMTLIHVNDTLETMAFGFPLKFVRK